MNLLLTFAVVFGLYGHVVDSQFTEDCNDNSQCGTVSGIYMCRRSTGTANGYNLYSCNDLNQCKTAPASCKLRGKCTESVCTCRSGFTGNWCSADLDECADGNHCLNGTCMNTVGGFNCTCNSGYQLVNGNTNCIDINECRNGTLCQNGECVNTEGGFYCKCYSGFQPANNNTICHDIDESLDKNICQNGICNNTVGGFYCTCNDGFGSETDNTICPDIDECEGLGICPNGGCNNTAGGFYCTCDTGFHPMNNHTRCADSQSTKLAMAESSTSSAAIGGTIAGTFVLIVAIVVVAVILWRRRTRKQPSHNGPIPTKTTQSNITPSQSSEREYESSLPSTTVVGPGRLDGVFDCVASKLSKQPSHNDPIPTQTTQFNITTSHNVVSKVKAAIPVKQRRETANAPVYAEVNKFKKAKPLESANSIDSALDSPGSGELRVYESPNQQSAGMTDETTAYDVLGQRRPVNPSPPDVTYCHLNMALED